MTGGTARRFDRAFKLAALARMAAGENVSAVSRELGVRRKLLYQWRDTVRRGGAEPLRGIGRPRAGERVAALVERPRLAVPRGVAEPDELARAQIAALERRIGQQALELDFFRQALQLMKQAGRQPSEPHDVPAPMASSRPSAAKWPRPLQGSDDPAAAGSWARRQGGLSVERMCALVEVSRAGYYRHWRAPAAAETALRGRLQELALAHRHYGYRRLGPLLRREGWQVNHKRVLREDNLLCLRRKAFVPATTDSRHGWKVWPNLARRLVPTTTNQPSGAFAPAAAQTDRPEADGSPTSPMFVLARHSPIWPSSWTPTVAVRWAGR